MPVRSRRWSRPLLPPAILRAVATLALTVTAMSAALPSAAAAQTFDHTAFDALLRKHVTNGMVDYDAFKSAPTFARYLTALSTQDPASLPRDEQLALWINAYNAYTIQLIVAHGETQSIRNINKTLGLKLSGPWSEALAKVGGKLFSDALSPQGGEGATYLDMFRHNIATFKAALGS